MPRTANPIARPSPDEVIAHAAARQIAQSTGQEHAARVQRNAEAFAAHVARCEREDAAPVDVIFRAERSGQFKGDITAVFPYHAHNANTSAAMVCYAHVGQHGSCDVTWYQGTRPATAEEYAPLLAELRTIGYNPRVIRRINYTAQRAAFAAQRY